MFVENIKKACESSGLGFPEIAKKIGMSTSGLYTSLSNNTIKLATCEKIAELLGMSIYKLLSGKDNLDSIIDNSIFDDYKRQLNKNAEDIEKYRKQNEDLNKEVISAYRKFSDLIMQVQAGNPNPEFTLEDHRKMVNTLEKGVEEGIMVKMPKKDREDLKQRILILLKTLE